MAGHDIAATDESAKVIAQLTALTRYGEDQVWRTAEKALALIRAQRVQNGALRTLNTSLESEIALHRSRASDYHAAATSLDSEREANARLTEELDAMAQFDRQGHRADCAIRLPHPASICTCHIADKQRADTFAKASPIPDTLNAGGCE